MKYVLSYTKPFEEMCLIIDFFIANWVFSICFRVCINLMHLLEEKVKLVSLLTICNPYIKYEKNINGPTYHVVQQA